MRRAAVSLLVAGLTVPAMTGAAGDDAASRITGARSLDRSSGVEARYRAPSPCHFLGAARRKGVSGGTLVYEIPVRREQGACAQVVTVVSTAFNVATDATVQAIRLDFVSEGGKRLKTERLPVIGE